VGKAVAVERRVESFGETWSCPKDEAIEAALDMWGSESRERAGGVPRASNLRIMLIAIQPSAIGEQRSAAT